METCGTMVTVNQYCQSCKKNFKWRSQPFILGRYPAGNVLLSFAVLMAGASISKLLLVFRHMGLRVYEILGNRQKVAGLAIRVFVSDRHRGIAKWIRENQPSVDHYFDQWHVAEGLVKKLLAASKLKGCEVIAEWIKTVKNHIFWCSTSTKLGFQNLILAK